MSSRPGIKLAGHRRAGLAATAAVALIAALIVTLGWVLPSASRHPGAGRAGHTAVTLRMAAMMTSATGGANAAAFSPDGRLLAVSNEDGTIQLWDVTSPGHPALLSKIVRAGYNGSAFYWASISYVAFSPSGHILASADSDGTFQLWNITNPYRPTAVGPALRSDTNGQAPAVWTAAFSRDGRLLATGNADGTIALWDTADPARPTGLARIPAPDRGTGSGGVDMVAFGPDGHTLASGYGDGTLVLWNVASPLRPVASGAPLTSVSENIGAVATVAFSPDGKVLVRTGSTDNAGGPAAGGTTSSGGSGQGEIQIWNVANPARPALEGRPIVSGGTFAWAAFSPAGHTLAVTFVRGDGSSGVQLWNLTNPARPRPLTPPKAGTGAAVLAASSNGKLLATAGTASPGNSNVSAVQLWDVG